MKDWCRRIGVYNAVLLFALLLSGQQCIKAQQSALGHSVYIELLGSGGYYSINYGVGYSLNSYWSLNFRIGKAVQKIRDFELRFNPDVKIPLGITAEYGVENRLQLGVGTVYNSLVSYNFDKAQKQRTDYLDYYLLVAYKRKLGKHLWLNAGYHPMYLNVGLWQHWAVAAVGYTF